METQAFWNVIGTYNEATWLIQIIIFILVVLSLILAFVKNIAWLPKAVLGMTNLFIGIAFFLCFGTEPIQLYFAFPLYVAIGLFFIWDAVKWRGCRINRFNKLQWILLSLVAIYPLVSWLLGHSFPQLVTYIMPCPVISLSIVIYSGYEHKNKALLILMAVWGLTGIKSFLVNALEDTILLVCGIYCVWVLIQEIRKGMKRK